MRDDIERWNRKYAKARASPRSPPDEVLVELSPELKGEGWALDIACGRGANTAFLSTLGYQSLGVDCSEEGLKQARERPQESSIHYVVADLDEFVFPKRYFDLVVVVKFLDRKLIEPMVRALKPAGLIFYRTFNVNHLKHAPSFNPRFVLARGELLDLFTDLDIHLTNDSDNVTESLSYVLARRP